METPYLQIQLQVKDVAKNEGLDIIKGINGINEEMENGSAIIA